MDNVIVSWICYGVLRRDSLDEYALTNQLPPSYLLSSIRLNSVVRGGRKVKSLMIRR